MRGRLSAAFASTLLLALAACGETARLPFSATTGLEPTIPAPDRAPIPTINIAPVQGWPEGAKPASPSGTAVTAFATALDHPRWLYVLRNAGGKLFECVFVAFSKGRPAGPPVEVLNGFLSPEGKAYGRPVGVAIDRRGGLLVADDVGNTVWRVTAAR